MIELMEGTAALGAAAATGALGSVHCMAMCGPLVVAGSSAEGRVSPRQLGGYFGGRLLAYAAVGGLMGAIGKHALCVLPVRSVQLVMVGLVAIAALAQAMRAFRRPRTAAQVKPVALGRRRPPLVVRVFAHLPRRGMALGLATGLLPCGMLLTAWMLAAASASPLWGAAVMVVFGLVSMPALLVPVVGRGLVARVGARVPRAMQGAAWVLLALWIALRPLLAAAHHH